MANVIAFLPWVYVEEPLIIGSLRLLPYYKGMLPGNLPNVSQVDIDAVLSAYADRPNHPVRRSTIFEYATWHSGNEMTQEEIANAFRTQQMIAFSALSRRRLFRRMPDYCNFDTYRLVVQRFQPGQAGTFAFTTRRRDGSTSNLWGSDEFAFHRPIHVDGNSAVSLDEPLLATLLELPPEYQTMYESLVEFNSANTDSADIPVHVEVVMCKSAFEWLLGIDHQASSLVAALKQRLDGIEPLPCDGPLKRAWFERWQRQTRPLYAWAHDFCALRGGAAHGRNRKHFIWKSHQHLAFVAIFFPMLLKKVLSDAGLLTINNVDLEKLRRIDQYLMNDPFDFNWKVPYETHPWDDIEQQAFINSAARHMYSAN